MNTHIFEQNAPTHWAAGLPVIPLRPRNKMPAIPQWSQFGARMPTASEMDHWLASYAKGNIGLPLGPQSGMCVIDIDTEDEELVDAILKCLPKSPWKRVGKKGMALAYRFEGQKNFKLRGADGGMILEFLGRGNQVVLPPSLHPDTGQPYQANANLWEVLDQLEFLGEDIEDKLRALLGKQGYDLRPGVRSGPVDVVPAGERDVQMIRHAGYLARVVLGIDRSAKFSLAEAIDHMHTWVQDFTAKLPGDVMDPDKGVAKLFEFLEKDVQRGRPLPEGWDDGLTAQQLESAAVQRLVELNRDRRWTYERAIAAFNEFLLEDMTEDGTIRAIERIFEAVARDPLFGGVSESALIGAIQRHCKKQAGLDKRQLRAALNEARRKARGPDDDSSQAAVGRRLLEDIERDGELRYDQGAFWQWSGSCFERLPDEHIYLRAAAIEGSPLVKRDADYRAISNFLAKATIRPLSERQQHGVNFANGWLTTDLTIEDHSPEHGCTFTLPFDYDPVRATQADRFFEFLHSCWGSEPDYDDRVRSLQEMFAATMFRLAPRYQKAFLLFGRAGTGKSQLLNILRAVLPTNAVAQLGPNEWGERFALTDLVGRAANICGELPENGMILGSIFKQVVEGTTMRTEFKNRDPFNFTPGCAHWFASNYLPASRDTTLGFARRWLILDFNRPVRDGKKVENLGHQIAAEERDAIAAWGVQGVTRLLEQRGYTEPACHEARFNQMRRANNTVFAFLRDTKVLVQDSERSMKCRDVYRHYEFHVRQVGRGAPVSYDRFVLMLEDLDFEVSSDQLGDQVVSGLGEAAHLSAHSQ